MSFTYYIPQILKEGVKMILLKKKFTSCKIHSSFISIDAFLGDNVKVNRGAEIGSKVKIGDYSYINTNSVVISATIGKYCSIGYGCHIGQHEHPYNGASTSPYIYNSVGGLEKMEIKSPPIIGNDVWVGSHCIVLQGVRIGDGAIIAAGSVVTKDVPSYTVFGGVAAKLLKHRFNDKEKEWLGENMKWDLLSHEEICAKYLKFEELSEC